MYSAESQNKTKQKLFCVTKHTNVAVCGRSGWGSTACRLPSNPICWKTTLRELSWCWGARETRDWPCSSPWRGCGWCFHTVNSGIKILLIAWKQQSYRSNITFHSRLTMIVIIVISMNFARLLDWIHPALERARETEGGMAPSSEEKIMALYAIYVVHYPRVANKTLNTAAYADCSLSALRDRVYDRFARYPGGQATNCRFLRKVLKGLHKRSPSGKRPVRMPILQHHLRAIRSQLDLANNALHRAYWALWLSQWQGVNRWKFPLFVHSFLLWAYWTILGQETWSDPRKNLPEIGIQRVIHIAAEFPANGWAFETSGVRYRRIILSLKPTKTDRSHWRRAVGEKLLRW